MYHPPPPGRESRGDRPFKYYCPGNEGAELQAGRTGTSQCIPYQLQLSGHGTIETDECDNERHTGATHVLLIGNNEPNKDQEEVLLLDLW